MGNTVMQGSKEEEAATSLPGEQEYINKVSIERDTIDLMDLLHEFMLDLGLSTRQMVVDDDQRNWKPSNVCVNVSEQHKKLKHVFRECTDCLHAKNLTITIKKDVHQITENPFHTKDVTIKGLDGLIDCLSKRRNEGFCIVQTNWFYTVNSNEEGHATLLIFDMQKRIQWFFDPANHYYMTNFYAWMKNNCFLDDKPLTKNLQGFRAQNLENPEPAIQGLIEGSKFQTFARLGACSAASLLTAVVIWRFGVGNLPMLIQVLQGWLIQHIKDNGNDQEDYAGYFRRRLYIWQHTLTNAPYTHNLLYLFGMRLQSPVRQFRGHRVCGQMLHGENKLCAQPATDGWSMCELHRGMLLRSPKQPITILSLDLKSEPFVDQSGLEHTVMQAGDNFVTLTNDDNAHGDTGVATFGVGMYLSIVGQPLRLHGDFVVDGWARPTSLSLIPKPRVHMHNTILSMGTDNDGMVIRLGNYKRTNGSVFVKGVMICEITDSMFPLDKWTYFAVKRVNGMVGFYTHTVNDESTKHDDSVVDSAKQRCHVKLPDVLNDNSCEMIIGNKYIDNRGSQSFFGQLHSIRVSLLVEK